jgi:multiple sugar transport system substrate-binding protein/sn-glycerol 3-phosphate transport system substrate-binding protein
MSKKLLLLTALLALLVMVMPSMAQDDPYADVDPSGQTVVFWHQHSGAREEELQKIVTEFNESNEWGITVEALNQGGYGDIFARMTTNLAAGGEDLPQLVVAYQNQAATYEVVDGLIDINLLLNSPTWGLSEEEQADFFPAFLQSDVFPTFDNQRLGFPPNRSMEMMYYNSDWLAEMAASGAISFDGPPTTPDQFAEAACAAVENPFSGATGENASIGYQISYDASRLASWTFAFGGDIFDYEAGQYAYNNPETAAAVGFLKDLYARGCAGDIFESFGDQNNFGAGTTLFTVGSSSGLPFYRSAVEAGANMAWNVAPLPRLTEDPVMNLYGASVSIPKTTPEGELAAWLFIKFYTNSDIQARWARASNYFPVRAGVAEGLGDYFEADPAYKAAFDLLQYAKAEPPVPGYDPVRDEAEVVFNAIVTGVDDRPIEEQLAELDEFANEELALASEPM